MKVLQEYHILSKNLRDARRAMRAKRRGITAYQQECVLDDPNTPILACIKIRTCLWCVNKSKRV